ncbi:MULTISPECIES: FAD-binding and (Fe-S)-binding domain-containing protein [unclassified Streptomyces]|uniref:FAD-binding and (Fe-S)-binding domain-containing protein n=1 Tax=unclassified Streptomyces TaxID=2593676 RepID=UPI00081E1D1A|nr:MULTISPECIES: FAD-binding and (Fe-S)-binding domain-containing protein [unclassified Streptomyces]MYR98101.1 FAD-binding protein [Streptomyces sp. SID4937]SCE33917.1 FAD/FMN-containing dehydrogenase [Streptomyces sp. ScaeMP-e83]
MAEQHRPTAEAPAGFAAALRSAVRGASDFGPTARALTSMDASNYRRVPLGVLAPRDADDIAAALTVCQEYGVPVVARGGGTSIAGQATGTGLVLDLTRHLRAILDLDPAARTATVQPGVILDDLRAAAAPHGLTFGPDPSTHSRCTLGGMIGNNSCGAHSVAWGTTADNVRGLSVVRYGGEALRLEQGAPRRGGGRGPEGVRERTALGSGGVRAKATLGPEGVRELVDAHLALLRTGYPDLPRRISGYALDALLPEHPGGPDPVRAFCGSEGTLAVVTEATVRLVEAPRARALAVLGYADESAAAEAAPGLLPYGPLTVEGMAADLVREPAGLPRGAAWLFVETGGATPAEAKAHAERILRAADAVDGAIVTDPAGQRALWRIREDASGTATRMPDGSEAWPGWEDCAVPPAQLGSYLRDFRALLAQHNLRGTPYGHFGDGCIHVRIDFDLLTSAGVARFRRFSEELADLVVAHGGSLSGEHGDGQARAELLPRMYGEELVALFGAFKDLWDPDGGLNPRMLARPAPLDTNLRFAVLPRRPVDVEFGYPQDGGDFAGAVRRCVGVAKCRTETAPGAGVMCPSFRATGEEAHSTRGRARLLHEMLAGEVITDGWRSTEVRDALDLCLSCKGCRSDCPVGVDMATYKAEFLHHHYRGRLRPAAHYAMGRLPQWLRLAAPFARPLNALARVRPLAALAKRLAGIAPERTIPVLATETYSRWLRGRQGRGPRTLSSDRVVHLWADTFTEHLSPQVGRAAVRVLEEATGRTVLPPPSGVCCGLTYVSTGQLDRARAVMRRTLDRIGLLPGHPLVVLEPSCAATLRTDLPELLPDDPRAAELAGSVRTLAQYLEEYAPDWTPPRLDRPVVGQTHCHQHAVLGDAAERRLRERMGLTGELSGGCCGLAGNFGFEKGHWEVSVACAEEQLLPAVRGSEPGTELLADGFSCRTQLDRLAGRRARHLAEVIAEGLDGEEGAGR